MKNYYFNEILRRLSLGDDSNSIQHVISDKMMYANDRAIDLYENNTENIGWLKSGKVKSLHLPATICREISRVVCSEFALNIQGENARAEYLDMAASEIEVALPVWCEKSIAFGNMVFKPYVYNDNVYVKACKIGDYIPLRYREDGVLDSAVFVSNTCVKGQWYIRLEYHHIDGDIYTIENKVYYAANENKMIGGLANIQDVPEWSNIEPITELRDVTDPLYAVYRNPFANTIDIESQLGMPLYANCFDLFKECDELWESITYEMKSGERRVFATAGAFKRMGGEKHALSRFYKELDLDHDAFKEFSPAFRNSAYTQRLQEVFKRIEENCGLSYGTISDPATVDRTATEVKHSKERMQSTVTGIQNALQSTLEKTISATNTVCDLYGITPSGEYETVFNWDDSVIESRQEKAERAMQEYQMGLIDQAEYFVQTRGMNREEAEAYVSGMALNKQQGQDWFSDNTGA